MNLIFDFDGTICDSLSTTIKIVNELIPKYNDLPVTTKKVRSTGLKEIVAESNVPKTKIPRLIILGRQQLSKLISTLKTFPKMAEVIVKLSKKNTLGILTTNSKENMEKFLKQNKLDKYFDFIHSEIALFGKHKKLKKIVKKYSFNPDKTYYIGDETRDIEAAKKVGIKSVAVTWGFESEKVLQKANPDIIISSPKELLERLG